MDGVHIPGLPFTYVPTWPKLFSVGVTDPYSIVIVVVVPLVPRATVGVHSEVVAVV
jgi:hypothetical protein